MALWIQEYGEKFEESDLTPKILETALRNLVPSTIVETRVAGLGLEYEAMHKIVNDLLVDYRDHNADKEGTKGSGLDEMRMSRMQALEGPANEGALKELVDKVNGMEKSLG